MKVRIAYFSGTGSTAYVAGKFNEEWEKRGWEAELVRIGRTFEPERVSYDLLLLCYAVHACNPPLPVLRWIKTQEGAELTRAALFSVSGGGEVTPNLACRIPAKRALRKGGFRVCYEKMIVMPSNWIVPTRKTLADALIAILPGKIAFCAEEIESGKERLRGAGPGNRFLTFAGRLEHRGAGMFGKGIRAGEKCTGCGICQKNCPVGNISLKEGRPVFSDKCVLCLQCLYGCGEGALEPKWGKFLVIPGGYDFKEMLRRRGESIDINVKEQTRGLLWLGVRRYLLNEGDVLSAPVRVPAEKSVD